MSFSALRVWVPYSGNAASAPGGAGSGGANRVAVWADANNLTSFAGFTYDNTTFNVPTATNVFRKDGNATVLLQVRNDDTGASAESRIRLSTDADDFNFFAESVAAGAVCGITVNSGFTNGFNITTLGARPISFRTNNTTGISISGAGLVTIGRDTDTTTDHAINGNTEAAAGAVAEYWQVTFNGVTRKIAMLAVS
jgi:hypothetical protein